MKLTKMSLVAALLVGTSAFAVDNIQVSGDANLFYSTTDALTTPGALNGDSEGTLFDKDSSAADASLNLSISADLVKNDLVTVSGKASYTVLTTLGLENNFVSNVWGTSHGVSVQTDACYAGSCHNALGNGALIAGEDAFGGAKVENANYVTEAYVTVAAGNSALQLGRMELDTPLAFTEKWTAEKNTFEGAVVLNKDIPDTTIVAAYIGNGNGTETFGQITDGAVAHYALAAGGVVNENGTFNTYGSDGAYALAVVNNSFKPLTAQAWYYNVSKLATAYWLQADLACEKIPGLMAGFQYTGITILEGSILGNPADIDSDAMAVMLGYEMKDVATVKVAYSQTGEDLGAGFNTATAMGTAQSKLYTETWWTYGKVTQADTTSYALTVESPVNGIVDLGVYYVFADQAKETGPNDLKELTVTASKSFGPLDATLALINTTIADEDAVNTVQAYLTLNF